MATAQEIWQGRTISATATERRHTRVFRCTDADSQFGALQATGIPAFGSAHPNDNFAYALEYSVSNGASRVEFIVTVNYSTAPQKQPEQNIEDPTATPPEWSFSTMTLERLVENDINGQATKNTAGDAFEIVEVESVLVIGVKQILSSFNSKDIAEYENTVNTNAMWGYGERELWLKSFQSSILYRGDLSTVFFQRSIEIAARTINDDPDPDSEAKPWDVVKLNAGWNHLDDDGKLVQNTNKGMQYQTPRMLAEDGSLLADDGDPIYKIFRIKREKDFSNLELPSEIPS